jgi:hypothetical protein
MVPFNVAVLLASNYIYNILMLLTLLPVCIECQDKDCEDVFDVYVMGFRCVLFMEPNRSVARTFEVGYSLNWGRCDSSRRRGEGGKVVTREAGDLESAFCSSAGSGAKRMHVFWGKLSKFSIEN